MLATVQEEQSLGHLQELTSPVLGKLKEALIFTRLANAQRKAFGSRTVVLDGKTRLFVLHAKCATSRTEDLIFVLYRPVELPASPRMVRGSTPARHGIQGTLLCWMLLSLVVSQYSRWWAADMLIMNLVWLQLPQSATAVAQCYWSFTDQLACAHRIQTVMMAASSQATPSPILCPKRTL